MNDYSGTNIEACEQPAYYNTVRVSGDQNVFQSLSFVKVALSRTVETVVFKGCL